MTNTHIYTIHYKHTAHTSSLLRLAHYKLHQSPHSHHTHTLITDTLRKPTLLNPSHHTLYLTRSTLHRRPRLTHVLTAHTHTTQIRCI